MDEAALKRVQLRVSRSAGTSPPAAGFEAAPERSRAQIEELQATTAALESDIPTLIGEAVRDGLRTEALPISRQIAELRGLANEANRRLARIEADVLAERKARIEDLALLVDLVSAGWRGIDARLDRLEAESESVGDDSIELIAHEQEVPLEEPDEIAERAAA